MAITASTGEVSGRAEITVVNPDRAALVALYEATDGPNWKDNENWLSDRPLDEWYGVGVDTSGRVVSLDLSGDPDPPDRHGLKGEIPPELGQLSELSSLSLDINELTGEIPSELGNLVNLALLSLSDNQLTGEIPPELGNLTDLRALHLDNNQLTGRIPPELGHLANLVHLYLSYNHLTGGIPPELGQLSSLSYLSLGYNELTGKIPPEFSQLQSLGQFWFRGNAGLCAPRIPLIVDWLDQLASVRGPFCFEVH